MAASLNKVILIGRLGRDPETRYTGAGKAVSNFTLATDESYKDNAGVAQKRTEWHKIVVWGPAAENFVSKYLHKGDLVYVEGKLQTREWTDKESQKRQTTEVNVTDIKSLTPREGGSSQPSGKPKSNSTRSSRPASSESDNAEDPMGPEVSDEDIPF